MKQYLNYLSSILINGERKGDRTGTGTISSFGHQIRFNLKEGFPLVTTKFVPFRLIVEELIFFMRGMTNIKYLVDKNVHIWDKDCYRGFKERNPGSELTLEEFIDNIKNDDEFAKQHGELGPVYGAQWRSWKNSEGEVTDQLAELVEGLKNNPNSRRHILSAWNAGEVKKMVLPPCHFEATFNMSSKGLSCSFKMRSNDAFLGASFNIASYALLTHLIAFEVGVEVNELIMVVDDAHIYLNHIEQVKLQLAREPYPLPTLEIINKRDNVWDYEFEDIKLHNYQYHPTIKGEMST